jgi:hypothetical protein
VIGMRYVHGEMGPIVRLEPAKVYPLVHGKVIGQGRRVEQNGQYVLL